jgi:hypothetical protein
MKLGICYMVFDGEELLEFAARAVRSQVDHISVTYQTTSYFGNPSGPELLPLLEGLKSNGLIDELIFFEPDLSIHHKDNELKLRNIGLQASRNAGCTHHISLDVDEFFLANELENAKKIMDEGDYDFSIIPILFYYKKPTYLVTPPQKLIVSFIHPVDNEYTRSIDYPTFPFHMETTRRLKNHQKYKIFTTDEIVMHHMSHVRKDIRKKYQNSDNAQFYKLKEFYNTYDNYKLGGRVCLLPDYLNRKTIEVENIFGVTGF